MTGHGNSWGIFPFSRADCLEITRNAAEKSQCWCVLSFSLGMIKKPDPAGIKGSRWKEGECIKGSVRIGFRPWAEAVSAEEPRYEPPNMADLLNPPFEDSCSHATESTNYSPGAWNLCFSCLQTWEDLLHKVAAGQGFSLQGFLFKKQEGTSGCKWTAATAQALHCAEGCYCPGAALSDTATVLP